MPRRGETKSPSPGSGRDPSGDVRVPVPAIRVRLLRALATMPEEAYGWFVLACYPAAQPLGANTQIWPDGIGGFAGASRVAITEVRAAAASYVEAAGRPSSRAAAPRSPTT